MNDNKSTRNHGGGGGLVVIEDQEPITDTFGQGSKADWVDTFFSKKRKKFDLTGYTRPKKGDGIKTGGCNWFKASVKGTRRRS